MYLIFIVYDATAHKMCLQILLQNKPAKFYQETNIEIYKCIVPRIYKKKTTLVVYSEYLLCSYPCKVLWHAWWCFKLACELYLSSLVYSSFYKYFQNPVYNICSICGVFHLLPLLLLFNQSGELKTMNCNLLRDHFYFTFKYRM